MYSSSQPSVNGKKGTYLRIISDDEQLLTADATETKAADIVKGTESGDRGRGSRGKPVAETRGGRKEREDGVCTYMYLVLTIFRRNGEKD